MTEKAMNACDVTKEAAFEWLRNESTLPFFGDIEPLHNFYAGVLLHEIIRLKEIEQRYNSLTQSGTE